MKRRDLLKISAGLAAAPFLPSPLISPVKSAAELPQNKRLHGISLFGDLKYPKDFKYLDYVNPDAPKGGKISTTAWVWYFNQSSSTFNTLNGFTLKGDGPPRLELTCDTLMRRAFDEPDSCYGLLAETVEISDNGNGWRFYLRAEARFHDGSPVTAEDVVFSFETLKEKGHPTARGFLNDVISIKAMAENSVKLMFNDGYKLADLFNVVTFGMVFARKSFENSDFAATTFEPILGSGPYKIGNYEQGKYIEYDRVTDYWGKDLPINIGYHNFDVVRLEFYRDDDIAFISFSKGRLNFRYEYSSRTWATKYNFPAVMDGRVKKFTPPVVLPGDIYGWFFNLRRAKFANPLVRQALGLAFDFEWTNKNLFYGQYVRLDSPFLGNDYMATGTPGADELRLLEPFRDQLPKEVFGEAVMPPVSDGSGHDRKLLGKAKKLLEQAGYDYQKDGLARDASGKQLEIEFLSYEPGYERIILPYLKNLELIGVKGEFRLIDSAQYLLRSKEFNFDMLSGAWSYENFPYAYDLSDLFGSMSAKTKGSNNLSGFTLPAIEAMIDALDKAQTRDQAKIALRSFDRILRALRPYIPAFTSPVRRLAMWDVFGYPKDLPKYKEQIIQTWWHKEHEKNS